MLNERIPALRAGDWRKSVSGLSGVGVILRIYTENDILDVK